VGDAEKSKTSEEFGVARPRRGVRAPNSRGVGGGEDLAAVLAGHCRQAVTLLPRGVLGVATAIEFLGALSRAHRLGLPDVTESGPKLFALLVAHGLLAAMPSPRVVPAALALVAGVSPLLQARSARQWTLWLGQLREPGSAVAAALREQTPASQISLAPPPSSARPLRAAALRADRDRLAAELLSATSELARLRDHAAREAARAADLQAQLELRIGAARGRKDLVEEHKIMVAEIREILGVADEDSRPLVEIVGATVGSLKEQTARADRAQEGLHRVLGDLAAANDRVAALKVKSSDRRKALAQAVEFIEAQEIKLAEANAELDLRRSRTFRPEARDVEEWRAAGAEDARRMQQERKAQFTSE
jgi:hypothetical protein